MKNIKVEIKKAIDDFSSHNKQINLFSDGARQHLTDHIVHSVWPEHDGITLQHAVYQHLDKNYKKES